MDARPLESDLVSASALTLALAHLTVDVALTEELENLSAALRPGLAEEGRFGVATREWATMLRSRFVPRADGPTT